jgi:hypothetical protein
MAAAYPRRVAGRRCLLALAQRGSSRRGGARSAWSTARQRRGAMGTRYRAPFAGRHRVPKPQSSSRSLVRIAREVKELLAPARGVQVPRFPTPLTVSAENRHLGQYATH